MRNGIRISCLALVFTAACQPGTEAPAPTPAAEPAPAAAAPAPAPAASPAVGEFGVAECDAYMKAWTDCIATKVPADVREHVQVALDATRDGWKRAAETEQGKAGLAAACKDATELARSQLAAYGCPF
jgi:hypothetical protein